jgi:hypothetical protein
MFDHLHIIDNSGPRNVTVTEQRAPTDASVALLREMEAEARAKVVQSVRTQNCPIECVIHRAPDYINAKTQFMVLLTVNGKRMEVRRSVNDWIAPNAVADELVKAVSDTIAVVVLAQHLHTALHGL